MPRSPKCGTTKTSRTLASPDLSLAVFPLMAWDGISSGREKVHIDLPNVDSQAGLILVTSEKRVCQRQNLVERSHQLTLDPDLASPHEIRKHDKLGSSSHCGIRRARWVNKDIFWNPRRSIWNSLGRSVRRKGLAGVTRSEILANGDLIDVSSANDLSNDLELGVIGWTKFGVPVETLAEQLCFGD